MFIQDFCLFIRDNWTPYFQYLSQSHSGWYACWYKLISFGNDTSYDVKGKV